MTIAKLPIAKDLDEFDFDAAAINETLVRNLAAGGFLEGQRNVVLIGGTGTGKTHTAIAIAQARIRAGARGRFFNVVDLVNKLEAGGVPVDRDASPITWPGSTSSCSTSWAICPSPRPADNCCSI